MKKKEQLCNILTRLFAAGGFIPIPAPPAPAQIKIKIKPREDVLIDLNNATNDLTKMNKSYSEWLRTEKMSRIVSNSLYTEGLEYFGEGPETVAFLRWAVYMSSLTGSGSVSGSVFTKREPTHVTGIPRLESSGYKEILFRDLPESARSISLEPFTEDEGPFIKLLTCNRSCSNAGCYSYSNIMSLVTVSNITSCIYCGEKFRVNESILPPYGTATVSFHSSWISILFNLRYRSYTRSATAYIPFGHDNLLYSLLGLWLILRAFYHSNLFTIGTSATSGAENIIFGTVHIKTEQHSDPHGYKSRAMRHYLMPDGVLDHLISECAANGIFTPEILDDMNGKTGKSGKSGIFRLISQILTHWKESPISRTQITSLLSPDLLKDATYTNIPALIDQMKSLLTPLNVSLDSALRHSKDVLHTRTSAYFSRQVRNADDWNALGFTQIRENSYYRFMHEWTFRNKWAITGQPILLNSSRNHLHSDSSAILAFHGTALRSKNAIHRNIDWKLGSGAMGTGFYFTLNPNEAKIYACRAVQYCLRNSAASKGDLLYGVVFELVIRNADKLAIPDDISQNGTPAREAQFNGREKLVANIEIIRSHIVDIRAIKFRCGSRTSGFQNSFFQDGEYHGTDSAKEISCFDEISANPLDRGTLTRAGIHNIL